MARGINALRGKGQEDFPTQSHKASPFPANVENSVRILGAQAMLPCGKRLHIPD